MKEIWKDIKGLEEFAMVSNLGNVKTKDRIVNNKGTDTILKGRVKKGQDNGIGYIQYKFNINNEIIRKYIHVMVLESFVDKPSENHEVNHIDHNKYNNKLTNLEWVTRKENMNKMVKFYGKVKGQNYCTNCNIEIHRDSIKCNECTSFEKRIVKDRPSKDLLILLLRNGNFTKVANEYKVSTTTIRKWCRYYGISDKAKDYK